MWGGGLWKSGLREGAARAVPPAAVEGILAVIGRLSAASRRPRRQSETPRGGEAISTRILDHCGLAWYTTGSRPFPGSPPAHWNPVIARGRDGRFFTCGSGACDFAERLTSPFRPASPVRDAEQLDPKALHGPGCPGLHGTPMGRRMIPGHDQGTVATQREL